MAGEILDFDAIFCAAIAIESAADRADYIARMCGDDTDLRGRVEKLVTAHFRAGSFLEPPAEALPSGARELPRPRGTDTLIGSMREGPGSVVGSYKLLEQIGEGGFGVVFMAEQQQPVRRKVALKVLKPGMDTDQVVARFEAERQALALMDHPNIAQVFDGGETQTGRPYFVMELVRGIPITHFCDQNHLTIRQRLELFVTVCHSVQHAHQKGIIHRDLKPSNVMVTMHDETPVVKVIDFGIAKATGPQLTDRTLFTNFAQLIGTPMYMSPEQAQMSGLDIDTRSDIYSLGVLLYELLTGTTPFDQERLRTAAYDEVRRIIREEEPARPSTRLSTMGLDASTVSANRGCDPKRLRQLVKGELDWIVMSCLEKDRNRRYATANGLANDVQRYLRDEPVQACPPSLRYRVHKFWRRHKAPLTTATLLLAVLVLAGGISVWLAILAAVQKDAAAEARLDLSAARQKFLEDRADAIAKDLERLNTANSLIESGRTHADSFYWVKAEADFCKAIECRPDHSRVWRERAEFYLRLGLWDLAEDDLTKASQKQKPLSPYAWYMHALLRLYLGNSSGYRQVCRDMAEHFAQTTNPLAWDALARTCLLVDDPVVDRVRLLQLAEQAKKDRTWSWRLANLGMAHYRVGQYDKAVARVRDCQTLYPKWEKAWTHSILAMAHHGLGQADRARENLDAAAVALEEMTQSMLRNPPGRLPTDWWSLLQSHVHYREARKLIEDAPHDDARLWLTRGRTMTALGHHRQAVDSFSQAIDIQPTLADGWFNRAITHWKLGEWEPAIADYEKTMAVAPRHAGARNNLAWLLATCPEAKVRDAHRAVALAEEAVALNRSQGTFWNTLGVARYRAHDWRAAVTALLKSVELPGGRDSSDWFFLAMAHWHLDEREAARQWFTIALQEMAKNSPENDELRRFRAEAAALLGVGQASLPVISDGKQKSLPRDSAQASVEAVANKVAIYTLVLQADPAAAWAYERRGAARVELKQWNEAVLDFARAVDIKPAAPFLWYYHAMACLGAGDLDGHRDVCARMRQRLGNTTDPVVAIRLIFAHVPVADAGVDSAELVQWGKIAAQDPRGRRALGNALYRAAQYEAAARHLLELAKTVPLWGDDLLFLAMAQHRLGQDAEARENFTKAVKWMDNSERLFAGGVDWTWFDRVYIRRLHKEAAALFQQK
jgi:serine/threonine protein kinase/Flp pilus assembly protein TadD